MQPACKRPLPGLLNAYNPSCKKPLRTFFPKVYFCSNLPDANFSTLKSIKEKFLKPKLIRDQKCCDAIKEKNRRVTEENFVLWVFYKIRLFPDKACKRHWKQEFTVKTLVHCTERDRNLHDVLVWKLNLVFWKSKAVGENVINTSN